MIIKNINLLDKNRSCLYSKEIKKFKKEITKQENSPICLSLSTTEVANAGVKAMKKDKFCLVKVQIDV